MVHRLEWHIQKDGVMSIYEWVLVMSTLLATLITAAIFWSHAYQTEINVGILAKIESNDREDAIGQDGELGLCQINRMAFDDVVIHTGCTTVEFEDLIHGSVNLYFADVYINDVIPKMLRRMQIRDNAITRLASYNYGIGNVRKLHQKYGNNIFPHMPVSVQQYITKYFQLNKMSKRHVRS